jgi:hypothetical protein
MMAFGFRTGRERGGENGRVAEEKRKQVKKRTHQAHREEDSYARRRKKTAGGRGPSESNPLSSVSSLRASVMRIRISPQIKE